MWLTIGKYALCALIGYLLGCISPSYLIGHFKGYDVRESGSGNAGASNTVIMAGKLAGLAVALLDILKAAGVCALLGHMFPVFLHFRGGRGLACLGGLALAFDPKVLLLMLGIAILIGVLTNYVCIATVCMSVIFPAYYGFVTRDWIGAAILLMPAIPIFLKHIKNFRRIRDGQELRLSFLLNKDKELKRIGFEEKSDQN